MQHIQLTTKIAAPIERCFLLSLSIDLHKASTSRTSEEAIAGITSGIIGPNQSVTFRARHFGFILTHTSLISAYDRPHYFQDIMQRGMFKSFIHDHYFTSQSDKTTLMRDGLRFAAPLGPLGLLAETLVLRRYLTGFLIERNALIKNTAEAPESVWAPYMQSF